MRYKVNELDTAKHFRDALDFEPEQEQHGSYLDFGVETWSKRPPEGEGVCELVFVYC
eukprot:COSAG02_NODE_29462_length_568_cov_1.861407_1_plen_57_part_00